MRASLHGLKLVDVYLGRGQAILIEQKRRLHQQTIAA
jgi:hypothetical protein